MNRDEFEKACEKTVEAWDLDTLIGYAVDSMVNLCYKPGAYVVIEPDGRFESVAYDEASARALAKQLTLDRDEGPHIVVRLTP